MNTLIKMIGGPLDGYEIQNPGYFQEGDIEGVDTLEYVKPGAEWSPESVYVVRDGALVYDAELTKQRHKVIARGGQ